MKVLIFLAVVTISTIANAKSDSVYTSVAVEDCKTIEASWLEQEPEIDYYTGHCTGKDGYKVVISGGDIRYSLSLIYKGTEVTLTNIGAFHDMGSEKIEWRGSVNKDGKINSFHSLIYRLSIADYATDYVENVDTLFVVRLKGANSCVIGTVKQSLDMNEQARAIADDQSLPCLDTKEF